MTDLVEMHAFLPYLVPPIHEQSKDCHHMPQEVKYKPTTEMLKSTRIGWRPFEARTGACAVLLHCSQESEAGNCGN